MVTDEIIKFLSGPVICSLATANAEQRPTFTRSFLITAESGKKLLQVFFPKIMSVRPLADIQANSRVAVGAVDFSNFQSRQFKGKAVGQAEASPAELEQIRNAINSLAPMFGQFFGPGSEAGWRSYITDPSLKITVELEEIYNQTPGPGTGGRIQ